MIHEQQVERFTYKKGRVERDVVDSSSCRGPSAARATKATGGAGEGERVDRWTTNECPQK